MNTKITTDPDKRLFKAEREFAAAPALVWRCYTEAELLDQWWAPKPWKCETQSMDFTPGGKWIYDMVGPDGERHGAIQIFKEIVPVEYFNGTDAFTDEQGQINEDMPVASWENTFTPTENGTLVTITAVYPTREALETVLKMGMAEGVNMAQDGLRDLLEKLTKV